MDPHRLHRDLAAHVELCRGSPVPLGATVRPDGVNFAVASRYATSVTLLIFSPGEQNAMVEFPLDGRFHRTGEVWHAFLKGVDPGIPYAYRMDRVPNPAPHLQRFDPRRQLLDPYAQALTDGAGWGLPPRGRRGPRRATAALMS
jgi:isoamylase